MALSQPLYQFRMVHLRYRNKMVFLKMLKDAIRTTEFWMMNREFCNIFNNITNSPRASFPS